MNFPKTDYDSRPQRRGGCGTRLVLIAIGLAIFFFMRRGNLDSPDGGSPTLPQPGQVRFPDQPSGTRGLPRSNSGGASEQSKAGSKNGDWSMEDVKLTKPATANSGGPDTKSSTKGDWSLEEIDVESSGKLKLPPSDPKKTQSGDWFLEEVDSDNPQPARPPK